MQYMKLRRRGRERERERERRCLVHSFRISALGRGGSKEFSVFAGIFIPGEEIASVRGTRNLMGPSGGLEFLDKRKISDSARNQTPHRPAHSLITVVTMAVNLNYFLLVPISSSRP